jgi:hypothetical protein
MNKIFGLVLLCVTSILVSCQQEEDAAPICEVSATVRDLRGLDGCGFIFELEDGTRLDPLRIGFCGTMPLGPEIEADPLHTFEFADGKKVKISYDVLADTGSACMVGTSVKITCLTEDGGSETEL